MAKVATAELKVALILVYYVIIGTVGLVGAVYALYSRDQLKHEVIDYSQCRIAGNLTQTAPGSLQED